MILRIEPVKIVKHRANVPEKCAVILILLTRTRKNPLAPRLSTGAMIAIFSFKVGMLKVLADYALLGILFTYIFQALGELGRSSRETLISKHAYGVTEANRPIVTNQPQLQTSTSPTSGAARWRAIPRAPRRIRT